MKHSSVGHLMVGEVVSVTPSTPFKDVAKLLAEHDITGMPVLDEEDRVLGVISESDLLVRQASDGSSGPEDQRRGAGGGAGAVKRDALTAAQLMSAPAVCVHAHDTVAEAARTMLGRRVQRLPVVDEEDRLVGIITRRDLLQVFLRPDQEIRRRVIEEVVVDAMGSTPTAVEVHVVDGVVTLEGVLERRSEIAVALRLTQQLDGVVSVVDRLTSRVDDSRLTPPERTPHALPW
ncbi:CBS domain-containing protein [Streptomyces sp. NPDC020681]|uniref:CBS domain-containing protein n=1 Tax=Streptomyces sp. NPDC020681 TaxID=3365083 RepID=UPI003793D37D